jgi:hypothetical protein
LKVKMRAGEEEKKKKSAAGKLAGRWRMADGGRTAKRGRVDGPRGTERDTDGRGEEMLAARARKKRIKKWCAMDGGRAKEKRENGIQSKMM